MPFFAEGIVSLIVYYIVFMIIGDFAAYRLNASMCNGSARGPSPAL